MSDVLSTYELPIVHSIYTGHDGAFGYLFPDHGKVHGVSWQGCREEFASLIYEDDGWQLPFDGFLFFMKKDVTAEDVAEFISKFESLLEVGRRKAIQRSVIQKIKTNGNMMSEENVIWVTPGPFWFKQTMRFSLFTMLFRCANNGYKVNGDFFSALFTSYDLANQCKSSIAKFLDGYTWYTGKASGLEDGWHDEFSGREDVLGKWKNLVRPKEKVPAPSEDAILKDVMTKESVEVLDSSTDRMRSQKVYTQSGGPR